jgi:hypothetical protein
MAFLSGYVDRRGGFDDEIGEAEMLWFSDNSLLEFSLRMVRFSRGWIRRSGAGDGRRTCQEGAQ